MGRLTWKNSLRLRAFRTYGSRRADLLDAAKHQAVSDRVLEYLGLESAPVQTRYARTSRNKISDYIENLSDVVAAVRNSQFAETLQTESSDLNRSMEVAQAVPCTSGRVEP